MSGRVVHVNDNVEGAVYVGRAVPRKRLKGSPLANIFQITSHQPRPLSIQRYRDYLLLNLDHYNWVLTEALIAVRGKPLACWCRHDGEERAPDNECHADVILEILERYTDDELLGGGK